KHHIRSNCAHNNGFDLGGVDTTLEQDTTRRFHRHIGSGHFGSGNVALTDTRALENPLVGGVDHFFQVLVGQHSRWHITTKGADSSSRQIRSPCEWNELREPRPAPAAEPPSGPRRSSCESLAAASSVRTRSAIVRPASCFRSAQQAG